MVHVLKNQGIFSEHFEANFCQAEVRGHFLASPMPHITYIYMMKIPELYSSNHAGNDKNIVVVNELLWQYRLLVCKCPFERSRFGDLGCIYDTKYVYQHDIGFWTRANDIRRNMLSNPQIPALIPRAVLIEWTGCASTIPHVLS